MVFETGPYLQGAFFCEHVLREVDNIGSYIRVYSRIVQTASRADAPDAMIAFRRNLILVVLLKSGESRGAVQVTVEVEPPSGIKKRLGTASALMEGEDRGQNLTFNIAMDFSEVGLYWFHVLVDDKLLTKVPLRLVYLRMTGSVPPTQ